MSAAISMPPPANTDIAVLVSQDPTVVLLDTAKLDLFCVSVRHQIATSEPDVSTEKGREKIKSLAFKIVRSKTAIDDAGKKMNEAARAQINVVDAARRNAKEKLDELRDEARAPYDAWEAAETARVEKCEAIMKQLRDAAVVTIEDTAKSVEARLSIVQRIEIPAAIFLALHPSAVAESERTASALLTAAARLHREEAERIELAKLRADAAVREAAEQEAAAARAAEAELREHEEAAKRQAEHEARIAREAAEAARLAAEDEAHRLLAEERQRAERAAQQADYHRRMLQHVKNCGFGFIDAQPQPVGILQRELTAKIEYNEENFGALLPEALVAKDEALKLIQRSIDASARRQVEEEARQDAERRERDAQDRAAKAERDRLAAIAQAEADAAAAKSEALAVAARAEKARIAAEQQAIWDRDAAVAAEQKRAADEKVRQDAEDAKRAANKAHRSLVMGAAKKALMAAAEIDEETAKRVVLAISGGNVPAVVMEF